VYFIFLSMGDLPLDSPSSSRWVSFFSMGELLLDNLSWHDFAVAALVAADGLSTTLAPPSVLIWQKAPLEFSLPCPAKA
jgi:hypothetical protein